jgi:hypothetical protein
MIDVAVFNNRPDILGLNGVQIYPPQLLPIPLFASAVPATISETDFAVSLAAGVPKAFNARLGYELSIGAEVRSKSGETLIPIKFHILEVSNRFMQGLPIVDVKLVRKADGTLAFRADKIQTKTVGGPGEAEAKGEEKECLSFPLLCKWRAIAANGFRGKKGCHGASRPASRPHGGFSPNKASAVAASAKGGRPHPHPHHHHHHKHHSGFQRFLWHAKRMISHILVPVLIGIVAGMGASLLGMIVGQCMVLLYRRYKTGSYKRVPQQEEAEAELPEDEKAMLDDADLPGYDEVVVVDVVEKQ